MGPIMPYPVTVRNWTPGMSDMPPAVPYPIMPLPRVVYQWTPGMDGMVTQSALQTGLIAVFVIAGISVLTGGYRAAKRRRP
jgi:hypothetical protein